MLSWESQSVSRHAERTLWLICKMCERATGFGNGDIKAARGKEKWIARVNTKEAPEKNNFLKLSGK